MLCCFELKDPGDTAPHAITVYPAALLLKVTSGKPSAEARG